MMAAHASRFLLLAGTLGACAPDVASCVPGSGANLLTSIACDVTGRYDERQRILEAQLEESLATSRAFALETRQLESHAAQLAVHQADLQKTLADLETSIATAERALAKANFDMARASEEAEALRGHAAELEAAGDRLRTQRARLLAEIDKLERSVEEQRQALRDVLDAIVTE
jgi:chromosome segregation ATPase